MRSLPGTLDGDAANAMSCQKETVKKIREKEADSILAVKEN
jgi:predicted transposase YbfD/YdcC